jgi:hypothetical protein
MKRENHQQSNHSIYKLDPSSNRFRICPNCKKEHMVNHLGKDFCCDKCADDHYNQNRRLRKQAEAMLAEKSQNIVTINDRGGPIESFPSSDPEWEASMKTNVFILNSLDLDDKYGSVFSIDDLFSLGFQFSCYSTQGKNHNVPEGIESSFLLYSDYRIYRTDYNRVLIKKITSKS